MEENDDLLDDEIGSINAYGFRVESDEIRVNDELSGLVFDENLGVRWKRGAFDRRVRGDGSSKRTRVSASDIADIISIPQNEILTFLSKSMKVFDEVCEMNIANSLIVRGFDGGELSGFDNYTKTVLDTECCDAKKAHLEFLVFRLRMNFMQYHAIMLNCLSTAAMYSEFTGIKEGTVRANMDRGRYDIVHVCGVKFILVSEDEMMLWNAFLMEKLLKKDIDTVDKANRKEIEGYYRKMYGRDAPSASDSVLDWLLSEGFYPEYNEDVAPHRSRRFTDDAYATYRKWMKDEPVTLRVFALRISEMGFAKFNVKKRGFWVWHYNVGLYGSPPDRG